MKLQEEKIDKLTHQIKTLESQAAYAAEGAELQHKNTMHIMNEKLHKKESMYDKHQQLVKKQQKKIHLQWEQLEKLERQIILLNKFEVNSLNTEKDQVLDKKGIPLSYRDAAETNYSA